MSKEERCWCCMQQEDKGEWHPRKQMGCTQIFMYLINVSLCIDYATIYVSRFPKDKQNL